MNVLGGDFFHLELGWLQNLAIFVSEIKDNSHDSLTVTLPLFAPVLVGFIAFREGMLSAEGTAGLAEISTPSTLRNFVNLIGAAGIPCALFALGGSLAQRHGTERKLEAAAIPTQKLCL